MTDQGSQCGYTFAGFTVGTAGGEIKINADFFKWNLDENYFSSVNCVSQLETEADGGQSLCIYFFVLFSNSLTYSWVHCNFHVCFLFFSEILQASQSFLGFSMHRNVTTTINTC